jgi:ketosteroid isomerase-like protein
MPQRERVMEFVAKVRAGAYIEAIEEFYDEQASMRENLSEPRVGRDVLVAHERAVLSKLKRMRTSEVPAVLLDGDRVAINWVFDMTGEDGAVRALHEVAIQTWRGDRILHEQFFYDPRQLAGG